jgi:nucleoside-diphosphate-sugar epimerase
MCAFFSKSIEGSCVTSRRALFLIFLSQVGQVSCARTRDFVYTKDLVESKMLTLASKKAVGVILNIGTGTGVSVNRIAGSLKRLVHQEGLRNLHADARPGEIRHRRADICKAKTVLGYAPKFSLDIGLIELVAWFKGRHKYEPAHALL